MPAADRARPLSTVVTLVPPPSYVREAEGWETFTASPVHAQHDAVRAAFAAPAMDDGVAKYSRLTRVGIIVGGSVVLWGCLIGGIGQLAASLS